MAFHVKPAVTTTLLVGIGALIACNSVLGIEQAELDPDAGTGPLATGGSSGTSNTGGTSGTSGTSGTGPAATQQIDIPIPGCIEPIQNCSNCLASCPGVKDSCLHNDNCRVAIDAYRTCLGGECMDEEELCRERLETSYPPNPTVADIAAVADMSACLGDCVGDCVGSPSSTLASMCELYCACMADNCSEKIPFPAVDPGNANCLSSCATSGLDLSIVFCRKAHCEIAGNPRYTHDIHCLHAIGERGQCGSVLMQDPDCDDVPPGLPCLINADCCSNRCVSQTCD